MYGMKETTGEETEKKIEDLFAFLGEKPRQESVRVGVNAKTEKDRLRPIKVTLASSAHVIQILRVARNLKESDSFKDVFIFPDRTLEERKKRQEAVTTLKKKLKDEPNKRHFIRGVKVVTVAAE